MDIARLHQTTPADHADQEVGKVETGFTAIRTESAIWVRRGKVLNVPCIVPFRTKLQRMRTDNLGEVVHDLWRALELLVVEIRYTDRERVEMKVRRACILGVRRDYATARSE